MWILKLPLKLLVLPVILILGVFNAVGNVLTNLSCYVFGPAMFFLLPDPAELAECEHSDRAGCGMLCSPYAGRIVPVHDRKLESDADEVSGELKEEKERLPLRGAAPLMYSALQKKKAPHWKCHPGETPQHFQQNAF